MAVVIKNLSKQFRRNTIRFEHTTLKSELVRWLTRQKRALDASSRPIQALSNINLTIPTGQTLGLVGRNGSGKSTLLKLLTGIYKPTSGTIEIEGRISALLELGAGFHPEFSGRENILINGIILGLSRGEIRERMEDIIEFSEIRDYIDQPVRTYSSGMYMRLAFSVATHVDPDVLLIDEVLAVGDERFARKSRAKMDEFRRQGKTILLVTHDLGTLQSWCDSAAWLQAGELRAVGRPEEVVRQYREAISSDERQTRDERLDGGRHLELGPAHQIEIDEARAIGPDGVETDVIIPEEGVSIEFHFVDRNPAEPSQFRIRLARASDGLTLWTSEPSPALPSPNGSLRLDISRANLLPGEYQVFLGLAESSDSHRDEQQLVRLRVDPGAPDRPLLVLPHRWVSRDGKRSTAGHTRPVSLTSLGPSAR